MSLSNSLSVQRVAIELFEAGVEVGSAPSEETTRESTKVLAGLWTGDADFGRTQS